MIISPLKCFNPYQDNIFDISRNDMLNDRTLETQDVIDMINSYYTMVSSSARNSIQAIFLVPSIGFSCRTLADSFFVKNTLRYLAIPILVYQVYATSVWKRQEKGEIVQQATFKQFLEALNNASSIKAIDQPD